MRPSFILLALLFIAAGLFWLQQTPAQRSALTDRVLGPPPAPPAPSATRPKPAARHVAAAKPRRPAPPAPAHQRRSPQHNDEANGTPCGAPPTLSVNEVQSSNVYQFVNNNGVVSFSDKLPTQASTKDVSGKYRRREQYFRINLIHDKAPAATNLKTRIMADTEQIFMLLARHLDVDNLRQVYLDLRLLPTAASFDAYRRKVAPKLNTNSGFYISARNEAVVRLQTGRRGDNNTLKVVRHETTHLIAAALFGNLPKWLNEGLAEYFERMDVDGQAKIIRPSRYYLKALKHAIKRGTLPDLQDHLRTSRRQWLRMPQDLSYGIGWSVVYYLMTDPSGRNVLAALLDAQAKHRCERFDTADFLDQRYPGGIAGLNRDWNHWLREPQPPAHYF